MHAMAPTMAAQNPNASFTTPHRTHVQATPTSLASRNSALPAPHRSTGVFFTATDWLRGSVIPSEKPYSRPAT